MAEKKRITLYSRAITAIVSALIGTFVVPILALLFTGSLNSEEIGDYAMGGAVLFAVLGFLFPRPMEKILFVLTLFQPS